MAYDYTDDVQFAIDSVSEFGRQIRFVTAGGAVDAANPLGAPVPAVPSSPVSAVFVYPTGVTDLGASKSVMENLRKTSEQVAIIAPSMIDYEAATGVIDTDGSEWKISAVAKLMPGAIPLLYYVGLVRP